MLRLRGGYQLLLTLVFLVLGIKNGSAQHVTLLVEKLETSQSGSPVQHLIYESDTTIIALVSIAVYHYFTPTDSILAYSLLTKPLTLSKGVGKMVMAMDSKLQRYYINADFKDISQRFSTYPAGHYRIYRQVIEKRAISGEDTFSKVTFREVDSTLPINSPLRNRFRKIFSEKELAQVTLKQKEHKASEKGVSEAEAMNVSRRVNNKLRKLKGVTTHTGYYDGKLYTEFTYGPWYLGRYFLSDMQTLKGNIKQENELIKNNLSAAVNNELESFQTLSSQMRQIYRERSNNNLKGDVDVNFNTATGKDPYSGVDPTYMDGHALFTTEIKKMPIAIEGYYTTQDRNRQAKASYIRFRYDVEAAKQSLQKLISAYQHKFNETVSKGAGLSSVYGQYTARLEQEMQKIAQNTAADYGIDPQVLAKEKADLSNLENALARNMDTAALIRKATSDAKSEAEKDAAVTSVRTRYEKARQKLETSQGEIEKRQKQYRELQAKYTKYKALLEQYQTQLHLDSVANYAQIEKLKSSDLSYKEMAKAAEGLLPEGQVKTFVSGLTHLEAGILDRYESAYTLAGQTMKGGSVGYDLGIVKLGVSGGSVEYVNREGTVDKYAAYMGRIDSREYAGQKTGLVYYGYSPTRQILESTNFKGNIDAALPTFSKPIHIVSVTHSGRIGHNLSLDGEAAVSHRREEETSFKFGLDNMALKVGGDYRIPRTGIGVSGEWEHLGKDFENKSLPLNRTGTERYTAGVETSAFRNVLNVKLTWNYLLQQGLYAESGNVRWGIEARTKSKRFPSLLFAYKPFSTFRTVYDTLATPQRPLLGEVWLARGNYQLKRPGGIYHRFTLAYNGNRSSGGDSVDYKSTTVQAAYNYTARKLNLGINAGFMELPVSAHPQSGYAGGRSWFCNTNISKSLKSLSVQVGNEVAFASMGLQRFSFLAGGAYRFPKAPVSLRLSTRYSCYKLTSADPYSSLLAVQMGFGWHFSIPLSDKNENL